MCYIQNNIEMHECTRNSATGISRLMTVTVLISGRFASAVNVISYVKFSEKTRGEGGRSMSWQRKTSSKGNRARGAGRRERERAEGGRDEKAEECETLLSFSFSFALSE